MWCDHELWIFRSATACNERIAIKWRRWRNFYKTTEFCTWLNFVNFVNSIYFFENQSFNLFISKLHQKLRTSINLMVTSSCTVRTFLGWRLINIWVFILTAAYPGKTTLIMCTLTVPGRLAFSAAYNVNSGQELFGRSSSEQSDHGLNMPPPPPPRVERGNTMASKLVKLQELFCCRHQIVLPQFQQRFDYHTLVLFFKIKLNLAPPYLTELLPQLSSNCGYNFRKNLYPVPAVKKSPTLTSFFPRSIFLSNRLPSDIQSSTSLPKFKAVLRAYLKT